MISSALANYLSERQESCNARFAAAKARNTRLDAEDFKLFLSKQLSPLAQALESVPDAPSARINIALDQAYEIGLQLVSEKQAGPSAIDPDANCLWNKLFTQMPAAILESPKRVLASMINIRHRVSRAHQGQPRRWLEKLAELAEFCESSHQTVKLAQILAWRSGLPQYRKSALELAETLPHKLALEALDAPLDRALPDVVADHISNPWFGYGADKRKIDIQKSCQRIGYFRGFGGLFLSPPTVMVSNNQLLVNSADEHWMLLADAFGSALFPASQHEIAAANSVSINSTLSDRLPEGHAITSSATAGGTLAITSSQSHSIWLYPSSKP